MVPSSFSVGGSHESVTDPDPDCVTVIPNVGSDADARPSETEILMFG